jgi:putative hemolysin
MFQAALEIAVILILVVANGLLAGSEIAIVSAKRSRLRRRAEEGDVGAAAALDLANSPGRFLPTVQIGITAIAVIAGAFGGARVARTLAPALEGLGVPGRLAAQVAIVLVVLGVTYLTLVVGELVPKRIALKDPEGVASRIARPMQRLSRLALPLVRLLGASTDLVLRLLPIRPRDDAEVTEEEIRAMIAHATETGVLEATEQQIVDRLFRLSDTNVGTIMTPRERIVWLDIGEDPERWRRRMGDVRHSRYIVADGELDRPLGYVSAQELLRRGLAGEPFDLRPTLRPPHRIAEWTPAFRVLELFQWSGDHIALVTGPDERISGLVTLNDVLEGIVGDIPELHEVPRPGVVRRADGSWLVDGLLPFDEFVATFHRGPADRRYATLHAFVVDALEGRPRPAAVVTWQGLSLEIVDMDGSRVDKVLVTEQ